MKPLPKRVRRVSSFVKSPIREEKVNQKTIDELLKKANEMANDVRSTPDAALLGKQIAALFSAPSVQNYLEKKRLRLSSTEDPITLKRRIYLKQFI